MPRPLNNLTGKTFGRLTVIRRHGTESHPVKWECECECGTKKVVAYKHLAYGGTVSCGCYQAEFNKRAKTHGQSSHEKPTPTYTTWAAMKQRCDNPKAVGYHNYGRRGIQVCERWLNSFENFFEDMGERPKSPKGLTLDRIDNDGNYEPGNCKWSTKKQQSSNQRTNVIISYKGENKILADWARQYGISRGALWLRIFKMKWPIHRALTKPVRPVNRAV